MPRHRRRAIPTYYGFFNQCLRPRAVQADLVRQSRGIVHLDPGRTGQRHPVPPRTPAAARNDVFVRNRATAALYYYTPYTPNAAALANLGRHRRRLQRIRQPQLLGVLQQLVRIADGRRPIAFGNIELVTRGNPAPCGWPAGRSTRTPATPSPCTSTSGRAAPSRTRILNRPDVAVGLPGAGGRARVRRDRPGSGSGDAGRLRLRDQHRRRANVPAALSRRSPLIGGAPVGARGPHPGRRNGTMTSRAGRSIPTPTGPIQCTCTSDASSVWRAGRIEPVGGTRRRVPRSTATTTGSPAPSRRHPGRIASASTDQHRGRRELELACHGDVRRLIGELGRPPVGDAEVIASRQAAGSRRRMGDRPRHDGRRSRSTCTWTLRCRRSRRIAHRATSPPRWPGTAGRTGSRRPCDGGGPAPTTSARTRSTRGPAAHAAPLTSVTVTAGSPSWAGAGRQVEGVKATGTAVESSQDGRSIPTPQRRSTCTSTSVRAPRRSRPTGARRRRAVAYPANGAKHGFRGTVTVAPGSYTACAYAINTGAGGHTELGCSAVTVSPATSATDLGGRVPFGNLELATAGHPLHPGRRLGHRPRHDGRHRRARLRRRRRDGDPADQHRPDVAAAFGSGSAHGFAVTLPMPAGAQRPARTRSTPAAGLQRHRIIQVRIAPTGRIDKPVPLRLRCAHLNRASPAFPDSWSAPTSTAVLRRLGRTPHRGRSHGRWPHRSGEAPTSRRTSSRRLRSRGGSSSANPPISRGAKRLVPRASRLPPNWPVLRLRAAQSANCLREVPMAATSSCGHLRRPCTTRRTTCSWGGRACSPSNTSARGHRHARRGRPAGHVLPGGRLRGVASRLRPAGPPRSGSRRRHADGAVPRGRGQSEPASRSRRGFPLISSLLLFAGPRSTRATMAVAGSLPVRQGCPRPDARPLAALDGRDRAHRLRGHPMGARPSASSGAGRSSSHRGARHAVMGAVGWTFATGSLGSMGNFPGATDSPRRAFLNMLFRTFDPGLIGVFGWLDAPAPAYVFACGRSSVRRRARRRRRRAAGRSTWGLAHRRGRRCSSSRRWCKRSRCRPAATSGRADTPWSPMRPWSRSRRRPSRSAGGDPGARPPDAAADRWVAALVVLGQTWALFGTLQRYQGGIPADEVILHPTWTPPGGIVLWLSSSRSEPPSPRSP